MITRRTILHSLAFAVAAGSTTLLGAAASRAATRTTATAAARPGRLAAIRSAIADLETRSGGRLGVAVRDMSSGEAVDWRGEERFPLCSTFKLPATALVLSRVDRGQERLDRIVPYGTADLIDYSPVTAPHAGTGLSMEALCQGAMILSDNTAANLMLDSFGGPAALTAFLRDLGDGVTRIDRREPEVNIVPPGEVRDTTSPLAMLHTLERLTLGDSLSPTSRARLVGWLIDNRTGDKRLRAGLPAGWRAGDKTGSWDSGQGKGTANDVAILWPPGGGPLLVTAYLTEAPGGNDGRNRILAAVGRLVAGGWQG